MAVTSYSRVAVVYIWKKLTKEKILAYSASGCGALWGSGMAAKTATDETGNVSAVCRKSRQGR